MKMAKIGGIVGRYMAKEFTKKFLMVFAVLMAVIFLFETIELIRQADDKDQVGIIDILSLALYKLPDVGQQILPFMVLFAVIACLWGLSQKHELVCLRGAGMSVWQFLSPMLIMALGLGLLYIVLIHPLSAMSLNRYEKVRAALFDGTTQTITKINDGLWIRQEDPTGSFILKSATLDAKTWDMDKVTVFFYDREGRHTQRIDAERAQLQPGKWMFRNAELYKQDEAPTRVTKLVIRTELTSDILAESFSKPQTIPFWALPGFISALQETGFNTVPMRMYYQSLLAMPLLLFSMILLGGAIALRTTRTAKLLPVIVMTLAFGFGVFLLAGFLQALGMGYEIPVALAAWTPAIVIIFCTTATLSVLEDG